MKQEHQNQLEIEIEQQAADLSDLAKLSAEVQDKGLVREHRPVFIFDKKLAQEKSGNAARQAKFREKQAEKGLVKIDVPAAVFAEVKEKGGWNEWISAQKVIETKEKIIEISVPGPTVIQEKIVEVAVQGPTIIQEKIVIQHDLRLTAEQKKSLQVGEEVRNGKGFRALLARKLMRI